MLRGDDRCIEHLQRAAILGQLHIAEHLAMTFFELDPFIHSVLGQGLTGYQVAVSFESPRPADDEACCCARL